MLPGFFITASLLRHAPGKRPGLPEINEAVITYINYYILYVNMKKIPIYSVLKYITGSLKRTGAPIARRLKTALSNAARGVAATCRNYCLYGHAAEQGKP